MPPSQTVQDHFDSQQNFKAIILSTVTQAGYLFPKACTTPDFSLIPTVWNAKC